MLQLEQGRTLHISSIKNIIMRNLSNQTKRQDERDVSPSHWRCGERPGRGRRKVREAVSGPEWFLYRLADRRRLCVGAAQCSPCLCLSHLIKTFGFLLLVVGECASEHACVWETPVWRGLGVRKCSRVGDCLLWVVLKTQSPPTHKHITLQKWLFMMLFFCF